MLVILPPENYDLWLDPDVWEAEPLLDLLRSYPDVVMEVYLVSRTVNKPSNDKSDCIGPAA